jgi:hypothetical protein
MALKLNLDVTGHLGACRYLVDRGYRYSARTAAFLVAQAMKS